MTEYDLVQTWIPATMIGGLFVLIILDSLWLSYRDRRAERRNSSGGPDNTGGGGGGGNGRDTETKWHLDNKADYAARQWHEENRAKLRNRNGTAAQAVGAAPASATAMGGTVAPRDAAGGYWGPWLVLTSLILGAGIAFYALFPLLGD